MAGRLAAGEYMIERLVPYGHRPPPGLRRYEIVVEALDGQPFTFTEVEEVVGTRPMVNHSYDWRVIAARHSIGGWGAILTVEWDPLPRVDAEPPRPTAVEERLAALEEAVVNLIDADRQLGRRLDATISIAAREAVERIRKQIARVAEKL